MDVYPHLIPLLKLLKTQNKYRFIASSTSLKLESINSFIPVDFTQIIKIYPLDFEEFLRATKKAGNNVTNYLRECFIKKESVIDALHPIMMEYFRKYLLTGGSSQAVLRFVENLNITEMRKIRKSIVSYYKNDAKINDETNKQNSRRIYNLLSTYMESKVRRVKVKDIENNNKAEFNNYINDFNYLINNKVLIPSFAID